MQNHEAQPTANRKHRFEMASAGYGRRPLQALPVLTETPLTTRSQESAYAIMGLLRKQILSSHFRYASKCKISTGFLGRFKYLQTQNLLGNPKRLHRNRPTCEVGTQRTTELRNMGCLQLSCLSTEPRDWNHPQENACLPGRNRKL